MIEERGAPAENAADEARLLLRNQRPAEAARLMRAALSDRPGTAGEQMLLGVALAQMGERTEALAALERAVLLDPDDAAAHFNLGQLYRQEERPSDALRAYERALRLRPDYPAAATAAAKLRQQSASLAGGWQPASASSPPPPPRTQRLAAPPPATEWNPAGWTSAPAAPVVERVAVMRPRCLTVLLVLTFIRATIGVFGGIMLLFAGGLLGFAPAGYFGSTPLPSATTVAGMGLYTTVLSVALLGVGCFLWQGYRWSRFAMVGILALGMVTPAMTLIQAAGPYEAGRGFGGLLLPLIFLSMLNLDSVKEYCTR